MNITLNPNEKKSLSFKFEIEGLNEELKARLIFTMKDGMKLVCESPIVEGNVELEIPVLKEFYKNIDTSNVSMEVVSESQRFDTWNGSIEFEQKPKVAVESIVQEKKEAKTIKMTEIKQKEVVVEEKVEKPSTKDILKAALK